MQETIYKHYKGNEYRVIAVAKHSETLEDMVVYQDVNDENKIWTRPKAMFEDDVEVDGKMVKRFAAMNCGDEDAGKSYCADPKSLANIFGKLNNLGK